MPKVSRTLTTYLNDRDGEVLHLSRIRSCVGHLRRILGKGEASQVWKRIASYRKIRLKEGVSRPTIRKELGTLISALRLAWRTRRIRNLPYIPLPPPSKPRPWSLKPREIRRLLTLVPELSDLGLFLVIALLTGARISAIVELTWDRVDFRLKQINFRVNVPLEPRMKERAIVPMCATLCRILLRAKARATTHRVINVTVRTIQRHLTIAVKVAELPKTVTAHVFRHTSITLMICGISRNVKKGSANILLAGRTAGQKNFRTTEETYEHLTVGELRPAVRAVERQIFRTR